MKPHIPYRITIELAIGTGKTIQLIGETPDVSRDEEMTDVEVCAIAANALLWQSSAMATSAMSHAHFERMRRALNIPLNTVPF